MAPPSIREEIVACHACRLRAGCRSPLPLRGGRKRPFLVVAPYPTKADVAAGRGFAGPSAQFLLRQFEAIGVLSSDLTLAYAVCCPPGGRDPSTDEIYACRGNLMRQIRLAQPERILALGPLPSWTFGRQQSFTSSTRHRWYRLIWLAEPIPVFAVDDPRVVLQRIKHHPDKHADFLQAYRRRLIEFVEHNAREEW